MHKSPVLCDFNIKKNCPYPDFFPPEELDQSETVEEANAFLTPS